MTFTFTQHTKAWPQFEIRERGVVEELMVNCHDSGGFSGGFSLKWFKMSCSPGAPTLHFHVECFQDALGALLSPEILTLLLEVKRMGKDTPSVELIIKMLEERGAVPSEYHTQHDKRD